MKPKKDKLIGKIVKKDYNNLLEEVLEEKQYSEEVKSLLLSMIYKIEIAYNDYEKVKVNVLAKDKYIQNLINIIKNNIEKIEFIKKEDKQEINKEKKVIKCYQIERYLLYAISKMQKKEYIVKSKDKLIEKVMSNTINIGNNINTVEPLRDFNGFSWNIAYKEIEDLDYNLIYQDLIILQDNKFLEDWTNKNQFVLDYVDLLEDEIGAKYGSGLAEKIIQLIVKLSVLLDMKFNESTIEYMYLEKEKVQTELEKLKNSEKYVIELGNEKKKLSRKIKKIDTTINDKQKLKEEYEKRNSKLPLEKKIFSMRILAKKMEEERIEILKEIENCNKLMNPENYIKRGDELAERLQYLNLIDVQDLEKEIYKTLIDLQKYTMQCFKIKIENVKTKFEFMNLVYEFRYYNLLPISAKKNIRQDKNLKKDLEQVEKALIKKGLELKQIQECSKRFETNYEILKNIFNSKVISFENIYIKITKEKDECFLQILDENVGNEQIALKISTDDLKIKTNKKIKVFNFRKTKG